MPSRCAALRLCVLLNHNITSDTGYNVAAATSQTFGPTFCDPQRIWFRSSSVTFLPQVSTFAGNSPQFHSVCTDPWLLVWYDRGAAGETSGLKGHLKRTAEINDCERDALPTSASSFPPPCVVSVEPRGLAVGPILGVTEGRNCHPSAIKQNWLLCGEKKWQGVRFWSSAVC